MIKRFLTTAMILIVSVLSVNAQTITSAEVKSQIAKQLVSSYRTMTDADVQVKITATPFAEMQLPDGKITYKIVQGGEKIIPRDIKRIDVYVNDSFVRTLNLPAQTAVYKDVLVAADTINREQAITKEPNAKSAIPFICTRKNKVSVVIAANSRFFTFS